jgi:hypothetical protein
MGAAPAPRSHRRAACCFSSCQTEWASRSLTCRVPRLLNSRRQARRSRQDAIVSASFRPAHLDAVGPALRIPARALYHLHNGSRRISRHRRAIAAALPIAARAAAAESLKNPDWPNMTLHSYRVRWGEAEPDPYYAELENDKSPHFRCDPRDPGWFQTTAPTASFPVRQMGVLVSTISI